MTLPPRPSSSTALAQRDKTLIRGADTDESGRGIGRLIHDDPAMRTEGGSVFGRLGEQVKKCLRAAAPAACPPAASPPRPPSRVGRIFFAGGGFGAIAPHAGERLTPLSLQAGDVHRPERPAWRFCRSESSLGKRGTCIMFLLLNSLHPRAPAMARLFWRVSQLATVPQW